jgi:MFS family permease
MQYRFTMLWNGSERLGISISTLAIIHGGISLFLLLLYPLLGFLAGQFGKANFMAAGVVLTGCSVALLQTAPNLALLVIGIILGVIGMALVYSGLLAYMMEAVTSRWLLTVAAAGYVAAGLGVGLALLVHFLIRHRYHWPDEWLNEPRQPLSALNIVFALLLALCAAVAGGMLSQGFFYIATKYGSPDETVIALQTTWSIALLIGYLAGGVLGDLAHWLASRFLKRTFGRPAILLLGLLVACIGTVLLIAMGKALPQFRIALFVTGIGFGLFLPALLAHLAVQVRHQRRALLLSGYLAVGILASFLSSFTMGFIGQATGSNGLIVATALGLAASMGLAILLLILSLIRKSETVGPNTNSQVQEA